MYKNKRKQLRLKNYDYKQNGLYFITICIQNRECLLSEINNEITIYAAGEMIKEIWHNMPLYYKGVQVHEFVLMPNHIHGIIEFTSSELTLPTVIQRFKTLTTTKYIDGVYHSGWQPFHKKLWQRNYYEHVIRDEKTLEEIRNYIVNNPYHWEDDDLHP